MSFICNFCNKNFVSNATLTKHKSTANYCRKIQSELEFKHVEQKDKKFQDRIQELELELKFSRKQYQDQIELSQKATEIYKAILLEKDALITKISLEKSIVHNNNIINSNNISNSSNNSKHLTIMNNLDLSSERLKLAADNYTLDHYNRSSEGLVDWCVSNLLKDDNDKLTYICNDKNRRTFQFKSSSGELVSDPNADKLKSILKPVLTDKLKTHKKINYLLMSEVSDDEDSIKSDEYIKIHEENKTMGVEFEKELVKKTYVK